VGGAPWKQWQQRAHEGGPHHGRPHGRCDCCDQRFELRSKRLASGQQLHAAQLHQSLSAAIPPALQLHSGDAECFARGRVDTFDLTCAVLGDLTEMLIGHDSKGAGQGWHLQQVGRRRCFSDRQRHPNLHGWLTGACMGDTPPPPRGN